MLRSIATYVRRHHIGLLALFVALGGTAYAVQNAPKDSVVSKSIKDGQVKPQDLGVAKSIEVPEEHTIYSDNPSDEFTVKVDVPPPGLISVYATTELRKQAGSGDSTACTLGVTPPGESFSYPLIQVVSGPSDNYFFWSSAPDSDFLGTTSGGGGWVTLPPFSEGEQTFTFRLGRIGSGAVCRFRNTQFHIAPSS